MIECEVIGLERSILGCILIDQGIHDLVIPHLNIKHFSNSTRWLADTIKRMYDKGEPIDIVTVARRITPESDITPLELSRITNVVPSFSTNIMEYLRLLRDEYLKDWVRGYTGAELGIDDDPAEYIANHIEKLEALKSESYQDGRDLVDIILEAEQPEPPGMFTKITQLNRIDSFKPGRLLILGSRPSHGKTLLAMDLVRTFCEQGKKALVFSMEMTDIELVRRLMKNTNPGTISNWRLKILDRTGIGVDYIISNSRIERPDFIVIDYLGFIKLKGKDSRNYEIGDVTKALKGLAKEISCTILLIVQAKRTIDERSVKVHQMDDLADSSEIERDADLVMFIMRYELWNIREYLDGADTADSAILQIVKNRHGKAGDMIKLAINEFTFNDFEGGNYEAF
jgi:replicative DNA helicase